MAHDVFISHSSKDKTIANAVCAALEAEGIKCWIAPRNINPGQEWPEAIVNAVTLSRAMVLVFSTNANHSKDVAKETLMAMNMGIDLIPIKIEAAEPTGTMQYYLADHLAHRKWIDASEQPVEEKTEELLELIRPLIPVAAAMAKSEEQPLKSERFNLAAIIRKTKHYISAKPKLAAVLVTACLLLFIGAIGILSADRERAAKNDSDSQALPITFTDHEDYDLKISELGYNTIYIIDNIKGTIPLADLEIGSRVVDPSWLWQFRTGANFSYIDGDITKPVVWIVVAKDHFDNMEPHVTLLTDELIGKIAFDNSPTPRVRLGGTVTKFQSDQQFDLGSNHWGKSGQNNAAYGLRPWLNSTGIHANEGFYRALSDSFKNSIAVTTTLPNSLWENGSIYTTNDMVFVPSSTELGNTAHTGTFHAGRSYPFFIDSEAADRVAKIANEKWAYWTRSPNSTDPYSLYCVIASGDFMKTNYASSNHYAVRATINLKSDTKVYELTK